eukprot:TRINITY_DN22995_c0_g2_i1.p1 TRINITY_DN22995_c0_g2~~TRINITY_DN22995_c0_g2_i1.p1  ORF type:complete len:881 (+),score=202.89 TRINITY_DN22995_c0_g2_i1:89-2644(+)
MRPAAVSACCLLAALSQAAGGEAPLPGSSSLRAQPRLGPGSARSGVDGIAPVRSAVQAIEATLDTPQSIESAANPDGKTSSRKQRAATFAMGCFWRARAVFLKIPGVLRVVVGYAGGWVAGPRARDIATGATGHADAVRVFYDASVVSYQDLLAAFWKNHRPWQKGGQGGDVGSRYRSEIYAHTPGQLRYALRSIRRLKRNATAYYPQLEPKALSAPGELQTEARALWEMDTRFWAEPNPKRHCGDGTEPDYDLPSGKKSKPAVTPIPAAAANATYPDSRKRQLFPRSDHKGAIMRLPPHCGELAALDRFGPGLPLLEERPECAPPPASRWIPERLEERMTAAFTLWNVLDGVARSVNAPPRAHGSMRAAQAAHYISAISSVSSFEQAPRVQVCDIGLGAGHAAVLALLTSERVRVVSFQAYRDPYSDETERFLAESFPGRWEHYEGRGIPAAERYAGSAARGSEQVCEVVIVDGPNWARRLRELRGGLRCGALALIDTSAAPNSPADQGGGLLGPGAEAVPLALREGKLDGGYTIARLVAPGCTDTSPAPAAPMLSATAPTLRGEFPRFVPASEEQRLAATFALWNVLDRRLEQPIRKHLTRELDGAAYGYMRREQLKDYTQAVRNIPSSAPVYCEIGINAGHGTAAMMFSRPDLTVYSFDLHPFAYSDGAQSLLSVTFPDRWHYFKGWSNDTVPRFAEAVRLGHAPPCDAALVDGAHTVQDVLQDLSAMAAASRCGALVLIDDMDFVRPAVDRAVEKGIIDLVQNDTSHFNPGDPRNPCLRWWREPTCYGRSWTTTCSACFPDWGYVIARFSPTGSRCLPTASKGGGRSTWITDFVERGAQPQGQRGAA